MAFFVSNLFVTTFDVNFSIMFLKYRFFVNVLINRYFLLFLVVFGFAYFFNIINLKELQSNFPDKVRSNQTVATSDDVIYLKPAKNWLNSYTWTDGSIGRQQYFSRPPGYSMFILPFYKFFGLKDGLFYLKFFQLLFFSISVIAFYRIVEKGVDEQKISLFFVFLYGIFPIASGFVFYTLTEAITPALLIFYLYFLQKALLAQTNKLRWYFVSAFILGVFLLVRPVFAMFALPFLIISITDKKFTSNFISRLKNTCGLMLFILLPLLFWEIRVISICGEFPGLYPVYDKEVNTIYRPTHKAIWEFGKCWGISGKDFHEHIGPIWEQIIYPDSILGNPIESFIAIIPKNIVNELGEYNIRKAFESYQKTVVYQRESYLLKQYLPVNFDEKEQRTIFLFNTLKESYKSKHWLNYYVVVPFIYLKEMSLHSNLNLYIFQHSWRGNFVMELVRLFSLLVHFFLFVILICSIFVRKISLLSRMLSVSSIIYVLFLAFYFRELEERYTLPILPVLFLISSDVIFHSKIYQYVLSRFKKV